MSEFPVLEEIINKRMVEETHTQGGLPYSFTKLNGGKIVEMLCYEPDVSSFRDEYYYNTKENVLYKKYAAWVASNYNIVRSTRNIILENGRIINNLVKQPDPRTYSDNFYYNGVDGQLYVKILRWAKSNNI